jgi:hypothetical protein
MKNERSDSRVDGVGAPPSLGGDLNREPDPKCGTDSTLHVIGLGGTTAN